MYGLRQRLMQPRHRFRAALGSAGLVLCLILFALIPQPGAAHAAEPGAAITLTFTVVVKAGSPPPPVDVLFWFCPDAQSDGTGCNEMTAQTNGTFTYQFATTTGTTYQHLTIEWSHGRLPTDKGPIPAPPAHITCDYPNYTVKASDPRSITCTADFTNVDVTPTIPVPTVTPTPPVIPNPSGGNGSGDTSTLVTGLQIIIIVGLLLFVLLLVILIWQRMSPSRRA
jgi:hypothetical protein